MSGKDQSLTAIQASEVKKELDLGDPAHLIVKDNEKIDLEAKATEYVDQIINFGQDNHNDKESVKASVENFGYELQKKSANQSEILKRPLKEISKRGEDDGDVAKSLINLKTTVEDLDPASFDFEAGWMTRTLGWLPFVGTPLKKYFSKFESAQTVIDAIINSLEKGREQLKRDNITLSEDQKRLKEIILRLESSIKIGQMMDHKITYLLDRDLAEQEEKKRFIQEELLFPLRQRVMDLQQQLIVNQQSILASEIIIRNNKELVRGVNRALNVTVTALEVAVTTAMALADQKIVLEKINALNSTTNNIIAGNAKRLKEQGVEIQKQAASTSIDVKTLEQAFSDIKTAIDDISTFRREALPQMASSILEMDKMIDEAEKSIKEVEESNQIKAKLQFDL